MNRIGNAFRNGKAFIAYIMAGDPSLDKTAEFIIEMEKAGADLVEIGLPFSDPIAEGETIQRANLRAFQNPINCDMVFEMAASLQGKISIPLAFMTYLNPVLNYGYDRFFSRCASCGIAGIIIPDMPFEEEGEIKPDAARHGIEVITLVAPTSEGRVEQIARNAEGFIYLVSSMGVTGVRSEITTDIPSMVAALKKHTDIPVAVGFGIHTPEQARELSRHADGIIVGSALVNIIEKHGENAAPFLYEYVSRMKAAL